MPHFGQDLLVQAQAKGSLGEATYFTARADARRLARTEGLEATLSAHGLDALIAPATSPAWRTDLTHGDRFLGAGYGMAAVAGTPSVTVPMGDVKGLPVGVVFMGAAWSEPRLLGLAYSFEQATKARKAPRFVASIGADPEPAPTAAVAPADAAQTADGESGNVTVVSSGAAAGAAAAVAATPPAAAPTSAPQRAPATPPASTPAVATAATPATSATRTTAATTTAIRVPVRTTAPAPSGTTTPSRPRPRPTTLPGASADQP